MLVDLWAALGLFLVGTAGAWVTGRIQGRRATLRELEALDAIAELQQARHALGFVLPAVDGPLEEKVEAADDHTKEALVYLHHAKGYVSTWRVYDDDPEVRPP